VLARCTAFERTYAAATFERTSSSTFVVAAPRSLHRLSLLNSNSNLNQHTHNAPPVRTSIFALRLRLGQQQPCNIQLLFILLVLCIYYSFYCLFCCRRVRSNDDDAVIFFVQSLARVIRWVIRSVRGLTIIKSAGSKGLIRHCK